MRLDQPDHPSGAHDKAPRQRSSAADVNEYAAFAAQLAQRSERLHAGASPRPSHSVPLEDPDERRGLWRFATARSTRFWAGIAVLASMSAAVLAAWNEPDRPLSRPSAKPVEQSTVDNPKRTNAGDALKNVVPAPISMPTMPKEFTPPAPPSPAPLPAPTKTEATSTPLAGEEIRELQSRLKATGFEPGPIDGIVGPLTTDAARRYGEVRALTNSEPTKELLMRLRTEPVQSSELRRR